ncbi:TadE-like protein [Thermomonospora echinospora]|uniref:TadE-like protein n=1 Tax=Thermomonospora echinospora TaxID=1992 RepID=A0A1H6A4F9_9ACTN|nr:TadE family protein [Thermomonospora echinospora]SEG43629.1 TadE-like protein [Thermomonospora echinospora]
MTDRRRGGEEGTASVELAAMLPTVVMIMLFSFEALMAAWTIERVENAARTGARLAGQSQDSGACVPGAQAAMPGWLNDYSASGTPSGNGVQCRVRATVPVLFPGVPLDFTVERTVTMPQG